MLGAMGEGRAFAFGAVVAVLVAACGSSGHKVSTTTRKSSSSAASANPPRSGIRARLLTNNELAGFQSVGVSIYTNPSGWLSGDQGVPAAQKAAEQAMLKRDGFRAGARENLMNGGTPGLSLVEQFRSPGAARDAFALYRSQFKAPGATDGTYAPFHVPGIPGAMGFSLGGSGGGINIAFSDGAYYYLVGRIGGSPTTTASLIAAAQHLYHRVHG
jgi:hypothetical protein